MSQMPDDDTQIDTSSNTDSSSSANDFEVKTSGQDTKSYPPPGLQSSSDSSESSDSSDSDDSSDSS